MFERSQFISNSLLLFFLALIAIEYLAAEFKKICIDKIPADAIGDGRIEKT